MKVDTIATLCIQKTSHIYKLKKSNNREPMRAIKQSLGIPCFCALVVMRRTEEEEEEEEEEVDKPSKSD
jgi:hypothetical protein